MIIVIGRGHSGTRAIAQTLQESGVYMGEPLNISYDLLPPQPLYEACRIFGRQVRSTTMHGQTVVDFAGMQTAEIPPRFHEQIDEYLQSVLEHAAPRRGWKIPETNLIYPWIARLFPDAYYIHWVRDPRDVIAGPHLTDDLRPFNLPMPESTDTYHRRAWSWKYQYDIVEYTPTPSRFLRVRLEDFVLQQPETLAHLQTFLDLPLTAIPVKPEVVGRWHECPERYNLPLLQPYIEELGYDRFNP